MDVLYYFVELCLEAFAWALGWGIVYASVILITGYRKWKRNPQMLLYGERNVRTLIRGWKGTS